MGDLPVERYKVGSRPFTNISLDFLGPVLIKCMANKQANLKVWPLLFCCLGTGAVHVKLSHDYGTEAFLLQMEHYIDI